jgi:mannose-6-phosphate isomerase-like protein (cupin superfamily)
MSFAVRRVVTGHDEQGRAVFVSDGTPPNTVVSPAGFAVSELLWLDRPPQTADDGRDREGAFDLEPPPGGLSMRVIRFPPVPADAPEEERWIRVDTEDPDRPGMHATDTLDFMIVLDGEIVLDLDDGEHRLGQGDSVIQRGNAHRWRVVGERPCTYVVTMIRPEPDHERAGRVVGVSAPGAGGDGSWRRLVAGTRADGTSAAMVDGAAPVVHRPGTGDVSLVELWQTGGAIADPGQGGDPDGGWELEPRNGGIAFRAIEMPPGLDTGDAGWHTTDTIDVDVMISGHLELALPDVEPSRNVAEGSLAGGHRTESEVTQKVVLGPGDAVVQRGTHHKWTPVGDEPVRYFVVMIALRR